MTNLVGDSADPKVPAVVGTNNALGNDPTTAGRGVVGNSAGGVGVFGQSGAGYGVSGSTNSSYQPGPSGTAGVWGNNAGSGIGVKGTSSGGDAVLGYSSSNAHAGVSAVNDSGGFGLWARGARAGHFEGTVEITGDLNCESRQPNAPAVVGTNNAPGTATTGGRGVVGNSASGTGVLGQSDSGVAVYGNSRLGNAFYGQSQLGIGIVGESQQPNGPAVLGENRAEGGRGVVGNSFTAPVSAYSARTVKALP